MVFCIILIIWLIVIFIVSKCSQEHGREECLAASIIIGLVVNAFLLLLLSKIEDLDAKEIYREDVRYPIYSLLDNPEHPGGFYVAIEEGNYNLFYKDENAGLQKNPIKVDQAKIFLEEKFTGKVGEVFYQNIIKESQGNFFPIITRSVEPTVKYVYLPKDAVIKPL